MSILGMLAYLSCDTCVARDPATAPTVRSFFVDDRSLSSYCAGALVDAVQITTQWSRRLCLQENLDKLALLPRAQRRREVFNRRMPGKKKTSVRILGVGLGQRRGQASVPTARERATQALCRGRRLRWLPVSLCARRRLWRQLVSSTFSRGWLTFRSLASGRVKTARLTGWPSRLLCSGMQSVLRIFSVFLKVIMAIRCSVELFPICGVFGRPASDSG